MAMELRMGFSEGDDLKLVRYHVILPQMALRIYDHSLRLKLLRDIF